MRYWLDTEFIERPCTIDLISIGIVREDGAELYEESSETDWDHASDWVIENVQPHLTGDHWPMPRDIIANNIKAFVSDDPKPEFWGYYCDYDWVVFCWLFGSMIDLPKGWPMFCRDVKQWCVDLGDPRLPKQESTEHNALADARWTRDAWLYLSEISSAGLVASTGDPT